MLHSTDHKTRNAVLAISLASSFLTPFMVSSVTIALPALGRDLRMGAVQMSWVTTAYLLCSAIFLIPFGKVADTYGRKRIFFYGIIIIGLSSVFSALAQNAILLIGTRVLHGLGASMVFGTGMAMLTTVFPPENRGKVLGLNVSFTYAGLSFGPVIGGFITHAFGWRAIFWINVPVCLLILLIIKVAVQQEWVEKKQGPFDSGGALLYGVAIAGIMVGFSRLTTASGAITAAGGVVVALLFIVYESRLSFPMIPIDLFRRNRVFAFSNIAALINYAATYAIGFLMSLYLQYIKGMDPGQAGFALIVQPVVMTVFSPLTGRLSDRIEPRYLASAGMGCIVAGLLLLTRLQAATPFVFIMLNLILFGMGFALFSSPNTSAVMGSVDRSRYGVASATVGTMRLLGQVFSMGLTMLLISILIGNARIAPENYPQLLQVMHISFVVFGGLCIVGLFASLARGNVR